MGKKKNCKYICSVCGQDKKRKSFEALGQKYKKKGKNRRKGICRECHAKGAEGANNLNQVRSNRSKHWKQNKREVK